MKKAIVLCAIVLFFYCLAYAQNREHDRIVPRVELQARIDSIASKYHFDICVPDSDSVLESELSAMEEFFFLGDWATSMVKRLKAQEIEWVIPGRPLRPTFSRARTLTELDSIHKRNSEYSDSLKQWQASLTREEKLEMYRRYLDTLRAEYAKYMIDTTYMPRVDFVVR